MFLKKDLARSGNPRSFSSDCGFAHRESGLAGQRWSLVTGIFTKHLRYL